MSAKYEIKMVSQKVRTGTICDICRRDSVEHIDFDSWGRVSWYHTDWVFDTKTHDVCSPECYKMAIREALNDLDGNRMTGVINDLDYSFTKELFFPEDG